MSDKSKSTQLIRAASAKGDEKAKAILALYDIADSMKETGTGDTSRGKLLKAAAILDGTGNTTEANRIRELASKMPESTRGVSWQDAMKKALPLLAKLGKDENDVFKNGITKVCGATAYQLYFDKPEQKKAIRPETK